MLVYGTALFNGDGVPQDPVMAYAYVSRSAAQGLEPAKSTLKEMDSILPVDLRRKGVEIALGKAKLKPAPANKPPAKAAEATPPKAQPKEKTVAQVPAAASSGPWRIQLGAFSKRSSAEALYRKLSTSAPVAGHSPAYVAAGSVTRLQVGGYRSKAEASAACATLTAKGQACFPVSP